MERQGKGGGKRSAGKECVGIADDRFPVSLRASRRALTACIEAFAATLPVERVILFGSYARRRPRRGSDVDLCIVARGIKSQYQAACQLRKAIGLLRDKPPLSLIPITPERLAEKRGSRDPFFETVLREGVCIAEED